MSKNKITYGNVELSEADLNMNNAEIRITTMIAYPTYEALKADAKAQGRGYTELINDILNAHYSKKQL